MPTIEQYTAWDKVINSPDFDSTIETIELAELNNLLAHAVESLCSRLMIEKLLKSGADPRISTLNNDVMLWIKAFNIEDLADERVVDLLLEYAYDRHDVEFSQEINRLLDIAQKQNKALTSRSHIAYKTLGYEPELVEKKLDDEYTKLINTLADDIDKFFVKSSLALVSKDNEKPTSKKPSLYIVKKY